MRVHPLPVHGAVRIESDVFRDHRGWFVETWREERLLDAGLPTRWVQDNAAWSKRHVLRGLHFQHPRPQAKLVAAPHGEVYDVIADLREDSPTHGQWCAVTLSAENAHQLFVPAGCAHGYLVLSDGALVTYKCTDVYVPDANRSIRWDDAGLGIDWPVEHPILSDKDANAMSWADWRASRAASSNDVHAESTMGGERS
jgi:dTDP-4-dehydrorhamnose 3,5-epimerase